MLLSGVALTTFVSAALAQDARDVFSLGEINVVAPHDGAAGVGGAVVSREEIWNFDRNSLDRAVNIVPGVVSSLDSNGRRNESDIFVRGFGRWQVPMMIDGVRIYLPADNRLDFSRFLTADIGEIQIQKGYVSVLDGPGGMGGAINLVTRKPVKPFEAELQGGLSFGRNGDKEGWNTYAMLGSRQEKFYVQGSVNAVDRDFWTMSGKYKPTPNSLEDGGRRLGSDSSDWRISLKAGYTPNATDEYTINYIKQSGEKGAPLNVYNNPPVPPNSYWRWPWWDIQNIYWLSNTQIGDSSYVKTKAYYNTFDNALDAFDNITYTTQSLNGRFRSFYEDNARGGSVEFGTQIIPQNTLKAVVHYRTDEHAEWNLNRPTSPTASSLEPRQIQSQETWSYAAENTFHLAPTVDIVTGVSYDKYEITRAEEFNSTTQRIFNYPIGGSDAFNWQAAAIWRYSGTGQLHASVSDRSRFPTIFELYSTRFGTAMPNPNLGPERARNYELGWKERFANETKVSAAVFYSDVTDLIQTVPVAAGVTQNQNVGDGRFYGYEASLETRLASMLRLGGNYTYIHREIQDAFQPNLRPTGVPTHKTFLYMVWQPWEQLSITPSLEVTSSRWSDVSTNPVQAFPYTLTGAYTMFNVQVDYRVTNGLQLAAGVKNILDQNYELAWGLPQPGRSYYVKAKATF
jgi:iron complex outermembrane receptor protein